MIEGEKVPKQANTNKDYSESEDIYKFVYCTIFVLNIIRSEGKVPNVHLRSRSGAEGDIIYSWAANEIDKNI